MDLKQLNTFLLISNLLNFTKAADQLGYAQSSITAQIQQLENEMGVTLFERMGKKILLTDAGSRLVPYVTQILQLADNMRKAASDTASPTGTLTIGTAESLSIYRLPEIFKEYRELYPEVNIELKLLNCSDFQQGLSNGAIDVAFVIGNRIEAKYIQEAVALPERIQVLARPDHPFAVKKKVFEEEFEGEALLLTGKGCSYRGAFMNQLSEHNVVPRIVLETDSIQVIKQACLSGLGICVLPAVAVTEEITEGKLIALDFITDEFKIVSQLLYHKDKWLSPALGEFLRISKQILDTK